MKIKVSIGRMELDVVLLGAPPRGNCHIRYDGGAGTDLGSWEQHENGIEVRLPASSFVAAFTENFSEELKPTTPAAEDEAEDKGAMTFHVSPQET